MWASKDVADTLAQGLLEILAPIRRALDNSHGIGGRSSQAGLGFSLAEFIVIVFGGTCHHQGFCRRGDTHSLPHPVSEDTPGPGRPTCKEAIRNKGAAIRS